MWWNIYFIVSIIWFIIGVISCTFYTKDKEVNETKIFPLCLLHGLFWTFSITYVLICLIVNKKN